MYPTRPPLPVNHALHALLTFITAGIWAPVWIAVTIDNGRKMRRYRDGQLVRAAQAQTPHVARHRKD